MERPSKPELADSISQQQGEIRRYLGELDVLERTVSRFTSNISVPDYVNNNANEARNSQLSDRAYLRALNDFDRAIAERERGLAAESAVYARWQFGDFGLGSTNKNNSVTNQVKSTHQP